MLCACASSQGRCSEAPHSPLDAPTRQHTDLFLLPLRTRGHDTPRSLPVLLHLPTPPHCSPTLPLACFHALDHSFERGCRAAAAVVSSCRHTPAAQPPPPLAHLRERTHLERAHAFRHPYANHRGNAPTSHHSPPHGRSSQYACDPLCQCHWGFCRQVWLVTSAVVCGAQPDTRPHEHGARARCGAALRLGSAYGEGEMLRGRRCRLVFAADAQVSRQVSGLHASRESVKSGDRH